MHYTHILMLATVSLFTGMIAPCVSYLENNVPYALTNMQYLAYGILIAIVVLFGVASFRLRRLTNILASLIILLILSLFIMTLGGLVQSMNGEVMVRLSWGWTFLLVGSVLTFFGLIRNKDPKDTPASGYDIFIGITGVLLLGLLSFFIIAIAQNNHNRTPVSFMEKIFGSGAIEMQSGATLSPAYSGVVSLSLHRSRDEFSFIANNGTGNVWYPKNEAIDSAITSIFRLAETDYFVSDSDDVWQGQTYRGKMIAKSKQSMVLEHNQTLFHIHEQWNKEYPLSSSARRVTLSDNGEHIFWVQSVDGGDQVYKNGEPIGSVYPVIHAIGVAPHGTHWMAAVDMKGQSNVVALIKDDDFQFILRPERVPRTLIMNGFHSLYQLVNEDGSLSLVFDGTIVDRKLDEIRETYISEMAGYSYFGRMQGEDQYCLFTRYRGNLCGLDGYMNPFHAADGSDVIFAGLKKGLWSVYRGSTALITQVGYANTTDISHDYFLADATNPRYYIFIEYTQNGYRIWKRGVLLPQIWKDVGVEDVQFGYDGKVFIRVEDESGWRIAEL